MVLIILIHKIRFSWICLCVLRILAYIEFDEHIANTVDTGHAGANLISKAFVSPDPKLSIKTFVTYVRPLLGNCAPFSLHTVLV